ncbi:MAG: response regulator transcription factor [Acidobacteriota bacterium]|nr:response regulator transcription factor [Acidobacteriota bacterium]
MPANTKRPTVIVADDHAAVHPLISRILARELDVVGNVFDGQELVDATRRLHPDLVVVDVFMPVLDGIEAVKKLLAGSAPPAVVLISTDIGAENIRRARDAGVQAVVHKAAAAEFLLPAARAVLQGQPFGVADPKRYGPRSPRNS